MNISEEATGDQRRATGRMSPDRSLRLVLLGDPVDHSLSPAIHRAALAAWGIDGTYEARRVDIAGLAAAIGEIREGALHGANVTMPHKRRALEECNLLDADARLAGAVNTLSAGAGEVRGWNTDVAALRGVLASRPSGPLLVLGAGGAAAAALVAGAGRSSMVSARREAAAARLSSAMVPWGSPVEGAVVVNATPLGMRGESVPPAVLAAAAGLVDLAYGSSVTPAVATMQAMGRPVVDGIAVLVAQAAASFTIWTGDPAPVEVMERAARSADS